MSREGSQSILAKLRAGGDVTRLNNREFVLFSGLLSLAHEHGLECLETEPVSIDLDSRSAVFRCIARGQRGTFTGHGDGTQENLSKMVKPAFIRMAETRAIARALRFYLGIGMTAKDELPGNESERTQRTSRPAAARQAESQAPNTGAGVDAERVRRFLEFCDYRGQATEGSVIELFNESSQARSYLETMEEFSEPAALLDSVRKTLKKSYEYAVEVMGRNEADRAVRRWGPLSELDCVIRMFAVLRDLQTRAAA